MDTSRLTEVKPVSSKSLQEEPTWTRGAIFAILFAYAIGFAVSALVAGPWQAIRDFAAEALILSLWLLAAWLMLRDQPNIEVPVRRPRRELILGVILTGMLITGASLFYLGQSIFFYLSLAVIYALPIFVLTQQQDLSLAFGLRWPPKRAWLVLLMIIGINSVIGITLGSLLPAGELPTPPGADLAEELTSVVRVLLAIGQLAVIAAIPEELFFRVYLQPRLSRFIPIGWAILVQAMLFSLVHLPQALFRYEEPWPIALAGVFTIANGLIGGYLWNRTRSFPLLVLLHLFAYIRIGL
jgi:membrane protease YdiL (CAAX protease family)